MNGKLRGFKRGLYEGGLRQAALARWPGHIPAGRVTDEPWAFWDFLPTAVELAGGKLPSSTTTDGLSLVKFLEGAKLRRASISTGNSTRVNNPSKPCGSRLESDPQQRRRRLGAL